MSNTAPTLTIRDGWVTTGFGKETSDWTTQVAVQQDGKVLVAGVSNGLAALARYNTDGSLDTSFSGDGKFTMDMGPSLSGVVIVPQADGSTVVYRQTLPGYTVAHLLPNGDLDMSFGTNGKLTSTDFPGLFGNNSLIPLANGKVVTAGIIYTDKPNFAVNRYNADGTFDTSFGTNGRTSLHIGQEDVVLRTLVQPDGKILIIGLTAYAVSPTYNLIRLNANGTLDTSFDGDGNLTIDTGGNWANFDGGAMALQSDGKIVTGAGTVGTNGSGITLFRYKADGSLDTSFHGTGSVALGLSGYNLTDISIQKDGKILVMGNADDGNTVYAYVARFLSDGTLDQTFGNMGFAKAAKPATATANHLLLQPDGKLLLVGNDESGGRDFTLMRLNADGSADQTFATAANTLNGTTVFVEANANNAGLPVVINNGIQVHDAELAAAGYNGASLTLARIDGAKTDDVFSAKAGGTLSSLKAGSDFAVDGVTIGHVNANGAGTLTLAFGANATEALVNRAMQQIAYANTSDTPSDKVLINWIFSDGNTGAQGTGGTLTASGGTTVTIIRMNDAPVVQQPLPDQKISTGAAFSYAIPKGTFSDPEHGFLIYSVTTADGKALPAWLTYDPYTWTLSGTPTTTDTGTLNLQVIAKDSAGAGVADTFTLTIALGSLHLDGTSGPDNLVGGALNDVLQGFSGNDTLDGKGGADQMTGGDGNDTYYVDNAGDVVTELANGGTDSVFASISHALSANVENLTLTGTNPINGGGNALANSLVGNSADNILNGSLGADTMSGGLGNDTYYVDSAGDVVIEQANAGTDTVIATVTHGLGANVENLTLTGTAPINGGGNILNNTIIGNAGANAIDGSLGADTMIGGLGNDLYYVDNVGDKVVETAGGGTDLVASSISYALPDYVENLNLGGTAAINATGNALDNKIIGNSAANVIDGGAGADTMMGGLGNDVYYVDNAGDQVIESSDAAAGGIDTVAAWVSYTLPTYVENLNLGGTAAINATGNASANKIVGNGAANVLTGGGGADSLFGALGNDTLVGGDGKDVLEGGSGSDVFVFNAASESGTTSATWDVVNDFMRGQDKIDLRGIDANTATIANDAFTGFIAGTAAFTAAGQLKLVGGVLYGNTDADADAEFAIQLTGITQLTTADVML
jgi:uncharacterized delta-60 repeat protein